MNIFIIVDGLPYLYADGKAYAVRWDDEGFTVGAEVELIEAPDVTYSELSVMAKCENLDSIQGAEPETEQTDQDETPEEETEADEPGTPADADVQASEGFDSMTVAELKGYANKNGINLGGARIKSAIIEVITEALV